MKPNQNYLFNFFKINLDNNNLRSVDACVFDQVQTSALSRSLYPTKIELTQNPIDCDCSLFYLSRHRGYNLEANCASPSFYAAKLKFSELKKEDPSKRCDYKVMENICQKSGASDLLVAAVIVLAVLFVFFCVSCLVCCCKYMSVKEHVGQLQMQLETFKVPKNTKPAGFTNSDKAKLLA